MKTLKRFTGKDEMRPIMMFILPYYGYLYATDAHIAIRTKGTLPECYIRAPKHLAYQVNIPKAMCDFFKVTKAHKRLKIVASEQLDKLIAIHGKPTKRNLQNVQERVRIFDSCFNWGFVYKALKAFKKGEVITVYDRRDINLAVFKGEEYEVLIMRKMYGNADINPPKSMKGIA